MDAWSDNEQICLHGGEAISLFDVRTSNGPLSIVGRFGDFSLVTSNIYRRTIVTILQEIEIFLVVNEMESGSLI